MQLGRFGLAVWALCVLVLFALAGCRPAAESGEKADTDLLKTVQERKSLVIGVKYDSPPFGYLDANGQLKGLEIDLAHALAEKVLGDPKAVRFVQVNTSTRVAALQARQVDFVLATMTITPEREKIVRFTQPYYQAAQGIMVKADSPYTQLADLKNKTILYVIGGRGEPNLKQALPQANLLGFKTHLDAFTAFQAGRGDAFSSDDAILYGFLHEYCGLRILTERISTEPYGIAFRKDKASQSLAQTVQAALNEFEKSGYLAKLNRQWNHLDGPKSCPPSKAKSAAG